MSRHGGWHKFRQVGKDRGTKTIERPRTDTGEFTVVTPKLPAAQTSWWTEPATREEFDQRVADRWRR